MIRTPHTALLERYDTMWRLTQQMLEAARQQDWDRLIKLEEARTAVEEVLRQKDTLQWPAPHSDKKATLIRAILAADVEIKSLADAGMGELRKMIGSVGTEQKLKKAYTSL